MSQPRPQLINTTTATTITTTMGVEVVIVGGGANIYVDRDVNVDGGITKMKRNTNIYPTLEVVLAMRVMT